MPVRLFKNTYIIYRTSPVAASDSFRFPACNFIKKKAPAKMFICEFCKIFKNIFRQKHLRMTASCVYLWILRSFPDHLFYKACLLFSFRSCWISTATYSKKIFHMCFSSFLYKKKQLLEGVHVLKIPKSYLWRSYSANIRLDEDVLKTSFIFVFRRRVQDVLKTSWSSWICSP